MRARKSRGAWAWVAAALAAAGATAESARAQDAPAVELSALYTGEAWRNLEGGVRRGSVYIENLEVALEVDAERTFGWNGVSFRISGFYNDDDTVSEHLVGDIQAVSNKDATDGTRLYEAWLLKEIGEAWVKAGVVDLNADFSVNGTGSLLINGAQGLGLDMADAGVEGPSLFPTTGLGVVGAAPIAGHWSVKAGAFDGVPRDPDRPQRDTFHLAGDDGALLIAELSHGAEGEMRLAAGLWAHTAELEYVDDPTRKGSSAGAYVLAEGKLAQWGERRLDGFARLGVSDPRTQQIAAHFNGGVVLSKPFLGAEGEALGVGVTSARNGSRYRRGQALLGNPVERREMTFELTYRAQVTPWLAVQPDVQYVINPGMDPSLKNALVMGVRFDIKWSAGR